MGGEKPFQYDSGMIPREDRIPKDVARGGNRWFLAMAFAVITSVGGGFAADLEAAWDAQLRGRLLLAQVLLETDGALTPAHRLAVADVALELGDLDRAQEALKPLTGNKANPDYPYAVLLLGRLHLAVGRDDAARTAFVASLEQSADGPYAAAAHLALIRLDFHAGAFDHAGERLTLLASLGPSPEFEMALELFDPGRRNSFVRPFASPLGLFTAARLASDVVPTPNASLLLLAESRADRTQPSEKMDEPEAPGRHPLTSLVISESPAVVTESLVDTVQDQSSDAQVKIRVGLVSVNSDTSQGGQWVTLQLGIFGELANAQQMVNSLEDAGYQALTQVAGSFYRVILDARSTHQEAELLLKNLQTIGYKGYVIPYSGDVNE